MAIQTLKPYRRVGVGAQYVCFHGEPEEDGTPTFEATVDKLKTVSTIETTEERSAQKVFASNEEYDTDVSSEPPTIAVDNVAFPPLDLARMRGNSVSGGYITHSTFDEGEHFAYGVVFPKKSGKFTFVWYPKCKMVSNSDSAQTKDSSSPNSQARKIEIQTFTFNENGNYKIEYDYELLAAGVPPVTEAEFFATPLLAPIPAT